MSVIKGNRLHMEGTAAGTVVIGTVKTQIGPVMDTVELAYKALVLYSKGAATLTHGIVEYSPDGNKWGTLDGTTFANLGSDAILKNQWSNDALRFFKVSGAVASGSVATVMYYWNF